MSELVKVEASAFGLETSQAEQMTKGLVVAKAEREELVKRFEIAKNTEITKDSIKAFKRLRLDISNNRTKKIDPWKKREKAVFLAGGRFVDALYNKEVAINKEMEAELLKCENHFDDLEKERVKKLQNEREEALSNFVEGEITMNLTDMDSEVWDIYLANQEKKYNDKIEAEAEAKAKAEAEAKAEKERIAKIEAENLKLKKEKEEADKKEKARQKALAKVEAERKAKLEAEEKEKARAKQIEFDKLAEIEAAKQKVIQDKLDKANAEAKAKQDAIDKLEREKKEAEEKAEKERLEAERLESLKGDEEKIKDVLQYFDDFKSKFPKESFENETNKRMISMVGVDLMEKAKKYVLQNKA